MSAIIPASSPFFFHLFLPLGLHYIRQTGIKCFAIMREKERERGGRGRRVKYKTCAQRDASCRRAKFCGNFRYSFSMEPRAICKIKFPIFLAEVWRAPDLRASFSLNFL